MRVLLVEDHAESRDVLGRLLQHWGFEVFPAEKLSRGLALIQEQPFDVIVSDISLPDGTGYALVSEAKKRNPKMLALALSGYSSAADVEIGRICGFDHHLTKPFDCQQLRVLLEPLQSGSTVAGDA